ncbi:hypothetical protein HK105_202203 [Polyrhizophydium stewartii]|uniref:Dolichyldiphosphatase n=1 Tax=Polyrhizophydium stewartii TaxID=2732419 RepID=A0ABR4NFH6_9FUNG|nr:hypothetical protein HK105_001992 [Polyrhizophydium stewartii]
MNSLFGSAPADPDSCSGPPASWRPDGAGALGSSLASVTLTHVQYDPADPLGKGLAAASLLPIAILVSFVTLVVFNRDLATSLAFAGQLLNEAVNYVLKHTIREPRPTSHLGKGFGMPSSHAQFMWYFAVFLSLYTLFRLSFRFALWKLVIIGGLVASAAAVSYSRVHLEYHTSEQVLVGSVLGSAFGCLWFFVVELVVVPAFHWSGVLGINGFIGKYLLVRDTRHIPNLLAAQRTWALDHELSTSAKKKQ